MVKRGIALFWLTSIVCLGFLQLLFSRQFVHDDMTMIYFNLDFLAVKSWRDCFQFVLQQTKPVTNFFLALSGWAFHFTVFGQHLVSMLFHLAAVLLWYLVLDRHCKRAKLPAVVPIVGATLFAIAPVHSEAVGIAQFRGELIATLFTLAAWYLAPFAVEKKSLLYLIATLLSVFFAAFSKEIFLAISIAAVVWEWARLEGLDKNARIRRFNCFFSLCLVAGYVWVSLYRLYYIDKESSFSYLGNVGFTYESNSKWFEFSARAVWEGLYKVFTGDGLTTVRLTTRNGIGSRFTLLTHFIFLAAFVCALVQAFRKIPEGRGLIVMAVLGAVFYIVIPNANTGSEHYWYFAAAPLFGLFAIFLFRYVKTQRLLYLLTSAYALFLFSSLQCRLLDYRTRQDFARAELMQHPESWWSWVNFTLTQAEAHKPKAVIDSLFKKASDLGGDTLMPAHRLVAALAMGDVERLDTFINDCMQKGFNGRGFSGLMTRASLVLLQHGERVKAMAAARTSLVYFPGNQASRDLLRKIESEIYHGATLRDFIARPIIKKTEDAS